MPLESNVDLSLLYHDKAILAFRIRELSTINYVRVPFKRNKVSAFLYNIKDNNFTEIPVILSDSEDGNEKTDLLMGDQVTYDAKKDNIPILQMLKIIKMEKLPI